MTNRASHARAPHRVREPRVIQSGLWRRISRRRCRPGLKAVAVLLSASLLLQWLYIPKAYAASVLTVRAAEAGAKTYNSCLGALRKIASLKALNAGQAESALKTAKRELRRCPAKPDNIYVIGRAYEVAVRDRDLKSDAQAVFNPQSAWALIATLRPNPQQVFLLKGAKSAQGAVESALRGDHEIASAAYRNARNLARIQQAELRESGDGFHASQPEADGETFAQRLGNLLSWLNPIGPAQAELALGLSLLALAVLIPIAIALAAVVLLVTVVGAKMLHGYVNIVTETETGEDIRRCLQNVTAGRNQCLSDVGASNPLTSGWCTVGANVGQAGCIFFIF